MAEVYRRYENEDPTASLDEEPVFGFEYDPQATAIVAAVETALGELSGDNNVRVKWCRVIAKEIRGGSTLTRYWVAGLLDALADALEEEAQS